MSKTLPVIILLMSLQYAIAQIDTIKDYGSDVQLIDVQPYDSFVARVDLGGNILLHGLAIKMTCEDSCAFDLDVYGQEGGLPDPITKFELTETIEKTLQASDTLCEVLFNEPIFLDTDHYFISISRIRGALKVHMDNRQGEASCNSQSGGNYSTTLYYDNMGRLFQKYNRIMVDQYLSPDTTFSEVQFLDATDELLGPKRYAGFAVSCGDVTGNGRLDLMIDRHLMEGKKVGPYNKSIGKIKLPAHYGLKHIFMDFENDGDLDVLIFRGKAVEQYINLNNNKFKKLPLKLPKVPHLSSIAYADATGNGFLDVFLTQQWEHYPKPAPNYFLESNGKTYTDNTSLFYPEHKGKENFPNRISCDTLDLKATCVFDLNRNTRTKEAQFSDLDGDGDLDLYLTNYFLELDEYYEAIEPGKFVKKDLKDHNLHKPVSDTSEYLPTSDMLPALVRGHHGTGLELVDLDNDLDVDILISQLAHPRYILDYGHLSTTFHMNQGAGNFKPKAKSGLAYEETHATILTGDVNNDGLTDLFLTAYYGCRYADLYMQLADGSFINVSNDSGLGKLEAGEDGCFVDLDGDGRLDLLTKVDGRFKIFMNKTINKNSWIAVKLTDTKGNRDGVGAKVIVHTSEGMMMKEMGLVKGKLYQPPHQVHFGLGQRELEKIVVIWPDGEAQSYIPAKSDQLVVVKR